MHLQKRVVETGVNQSYLNFVHNPQCFHVKGSCSLYRKNRFQPLGVKKRAVRDVMILMRANPLQGPTPSNGPSNGFAPIKMIKS